MQLKFADSSSDRRAPPIIAPRGTVPVAFSPRSFHKCSHDGGLQRVIFKPARVISDETEAVSQCGSLRKLPYARGAPGAH